MPGVQRLIRPYRFLCMWALTAVSRLAMCACLAASVFPGRLLLLPRLASRVTLAVRADARDVIYLSIPPSTSGNSRINRGPVMKPTSEVSTKSEITRYFPNAHSTICRTWALLCPSFACYRGLLLLTEDNAHYWEHPSNQPDWLEQM